MSGEPLTIVPEDRLCTANVHGTDRRCKVAAIKGGSVCVFHGGRAPQVRAAANRRLMEMVDFALAELMVLLVDRNTPHAVKLGAIKDVLSRCGLDPTLKIEADVSIWDSREELLRQAEALLVANDESRSTPIPE